MPESNVNPKGRSIQKEDIETLEREIIEADKLSQMMKTEGWKIYNEKLNKGLEGLLTRYYMDGSKLPIEPMARLAIVDAQMETYRQLGYFVSLADNLIGSVKDKLDDMKNAVNYTDHEQTIKDCVGDIFTSI